MDVHDVSAAYIRAFLLYHLYFVTCISVRVFKIHIYIFKFSVLMQCHQFMSVIRGL